MTVKVGRFNINFNAIMNKDIRIIAKAFEVTKTQVIKDAVQYAIFKHKDQALKALKDRNIDPDTLLPIETIKEK